MQRSKRVLVGAVAVLALVAIAWFVSSPKWFVASTRSAADVADVQRASAATELAASPSVADPASAEARRALEATSSLSPLAEALVALGPVATDAGVVVLVTVVDNPWLTHGWHGRLRWTDGTAEAKWSTVANRRVTLPRAPESIAQFTQVSFEGLAARPVSLTALEPLEPTDDIGRAPTFELLTELERGADLVWASSVPRDEQTPVRVTFGGMQPPGTATRIRIQGAHEFVNPLHDVELPQTLPRVAAPTSIWVGAAAHQWRALGLAPDDTRIEVSLERSATLRVLHDSAIGTRVVASARKLRQESRATIESEQPLELPDLSAGRFQVWIEGGKREVLTRVAIVELVAGATTEVDLRASATLDGRGTARIFVRALPEIIAAATEGVDLAWVYDGAEATRIRLPAEPRSVATTQEGLAFEALGLDPGRYEVVVSPFCRTAEFDVVAGEVVDVEIVVDCVGFVDFELPSGIGGLSILSVEPVDGRAEPRRFRAWAPQGPGALLPLSCGTYRVQERNSDVVLESDVFAVTSGATTTAVMRAQSLSRATLAVVDSVSGAPLALEASFWTGVELRDDATGARLYSTMSFGAVKGAFTDVEWALTPHSELVRVVAPEHRFWTFEPLEPFELVDGATITLRATAK